MAKIKNREDFERWLKDKPFEIAQAMATRIALRVLPLWRPPKGRSDLTLSLMRALFISWAACRYPLHDMRSAASYASTAAKSAANAADAADRSTARSTAASAADAAAAAADSTTATSADRYAARSLAAAAAAAAARSTRFHQDPMWESIALDADAINAAKGQGAIKALIKRSLWAKDFDLPHRWWSTLSSDLVAQEDWPVWTQWYGRRLKGETLGFAELTPEQDEAFCVELATQPSGFWQKGPTLVNKWIVDRLADLTKDDDSEIDIPPQKQAPLQTYMREGRIAKSEPVPPLPLAIDAERLRISGREAIIESIDDFEEVYGTSNQTAVRLAIKRLREALGDSIATVDPIKLSGHAERIQQFALRADDVFMGDMAADVVSLNISIQLHLSYFPEVDVYKSSLAKDKATNDVSKALLIKYARSIIGHEALELEVSESLQEQIEDVGALNNMIVFEDDNLYWRGLNRSLENTLATAAKDAVDAKRDYRNNLADAVYDGHIEGVKESSKLLTTSLIVGLPSGLLIGLAVSWKWLEPVLKLLGVI